MKSMAVLASVLVILSLATPALAYERNVGDDADAASKEAQQAAERLLNEYVPDEPSRPDDPGEGRGVPLPEGVPSPEVPDGSKGPGAVLSDIFCAHIQTTGSDCKAPDAPEADEPDNEPDVDPEAVLPVFHVIGQPAPEVPDTRDANEAPSGLAGALEALLQPVHEAGEAAKRAVTEGLAAAGLVVLETMAFAEHQATATIQSLEHLGDKFVRPLLDADKAGTTHTGDGSMVTTSAAPGTVTPAAATGLTMAAVGGVGLLVGAFAILRRLIGLGSVSLLSRIPSKDIMKNDTRAAIFDIVTNDPGVSLNEIVSRLGISRNAVAYHLAVFESESSVVSVKDGKYRRYFVNGGKYVNGAKDVVSTIKNDVTLNVIRYILDNPGSIQKDVCHAVGTSPSATNWHITRLEKVGLVAKEKVANTVRYSPGPSLQKYDLGDFGLQTPTPIPA